MKPPKFKVYIEIALKCDASNTLPFISHRVIMSHDVMSCYTCDMGEISNFDIRNAYDRL